MAKSNAKQCLPNKRLCEILGFAAENSIKMPKNRYRGRFVIVWRLPAGIFADAQKNIADDVNPQYSGQPKKSVNHKQIVFLSC